MLFKSLAIVSVLAATVAADGAAIITSLQTVDKDIIANGKSLQQYDGNIINAIPGLGAVSTLNDDLDAGTKTAQNSAPLSTDEAVALVPYVQQLAKDANATFTIAIAKAPLYKKNNLNGIVSFLLSQSKTKSSAYSSAIIDKVPSSLQATAQGFTAPIDSGFAQVIAAYQ